MLSEDALARGGARANGPRRLRRRRLPRRACASGSRRSTDDVELNALGRLGLFAHGVRALANRLRVEDLLRRHPEILAVAIERPIIVAGLPRSGTTHLVNLIAADTRLRSLPYWESLEPVPVAGEGPGRDGRDPRWTRCLPIVSPDARADAALAGDARHAARAHPRGDRAPGARLRDLPPRVAVRARRAGATTTSRSICARTYAYLKKVLQAAHVAPRAAALGAEVAAAPRAAPAAPRRLPRRDDRDHASRSGRGDPVGDHDARATATACGGRASTWQALADYWIDRVERLLRACVRDRDRLPAAQVDRRPLRRVHGRRRRHGRARSTSAPGSR